MAENLLIVESPAKAKTIEKILGNKFVVKSSYGHVRDLTKTGNGIDIENNFSPTYQISPDKEDVLAELKKFCKKAEVVWLATDEDREGEAISWHLAEALELDRGKTKRIVFNEITEPAIKEAIQNPRDIDMNLVDAQQARRILDRLVGFELSPVLWRKVKPSLSAGRVQSVAVRLIVEREREIDSFNSVSSFKVTAMFDLESEGRKYLMKAVLDKRFDQYEQALEFTTQNKDAVYQVQSIETRPGKRSPAAPFTTSTLQQEASRKLGYSVAQTMMVAQRLYEAGKITYMRTDSVNLSTTAISAAQNEIGSRFGKEYSEPRQYKTKSANAQEAHEAIRPTNFSVSSIQGESNEEKLYELIWKRSIASQMADAQLERTNIDVRISTRNEKFRATGEVIKFDGFLKVYIESSDEENTEEQEDGILPPVKEGQHLNLNNLVAMERFTYPPARFTEASLVKKLEELGIGRPSTYAPTISTIQKRGYVIKGDKPGRERKYKVISLSKSELKEEIRSEITGADKSKLFSTDIGIVVNDFLVKYFSDVLDFNFTARVEKEFDEIAQGQKEWVDMIRNFYNPFHKDVEHTIEHSDRATGERELGIHPETGEQVIARIGRFGPMVQINPLNEEDKPRFAKLRANQRIESLTLSEALELFKLPRILGQYEGADVKVSIGRFGPYVLHQNKFSSLPKGSDPFEIDLDGAIAAIEAKRDSDRKKLIKEFPQDENIKIVKGRWGPFISAGKLNIRIPKDTDPQSITFEEIMKMVEEMNAKSAPAKKKKVSSKNKAPVKKKSSAKKKSDGSTADKPVKKKSSSTRKKATKQSDN